MPARLVLSLITLLASQPTLSAAQPNDTQRVDLVRVDKSERRMDLVAKGKVLRSYRIALGANPVGQKQREGDERTPEGRYVLNWRNPKSAAYKSIHISYPDERDEAAARAMGVSPGGMVMIHGQINGFGWMSPVMQWFDWTNGCIAVNNAEMEEIWAMVDNGTPIEINP